MSPTQRTLAELRRQGYRAQVVEYWNDRAKVRIDLFGFIDIIAVKPGELIGVQTTSGSSHSARVKKIATECRDAARDWINGGGFVEVWSWTGKPLVKADGTKSKSRKVWELRRERLSVVD